MKKLKNTKLAVWRTQWEAPRVITVTDGRFSYPFSAAKKTIGYSPVYVISELYDYIGFPGHTDADYYCTLDTCNSLKNRPAATVISEIEQGKIEKYYTKEAKLLT